MPAQRPTDTDDAPLCGPFPGFDKELGPVNTTRRRIGRLAAEMVVLLDTARRYTSGEGRSWQGFLAEVGRQIAQGSNPAGTASKMVRLADQMELIEVRGDQDTPGQPFVVARAGVEELITTPGHHQKNLLLGLHLLLHQPADGNGGRVPLRPLVHLLKLAQRLAEKGLALRDDTLALYAADPSREEPSELAVRAMVRFEQGCPTGTRKRAQAVRAAVLELAVVTQWLDAVMQGVARAMATADDPRAGALAVLDQALGGATSKTATRLRERAGELVEQGRADDIRGLLEQDWILKTKWTSHRDFCRTAVGYLRQAGLLARTGRGHRPSERGLALLAEVLRCSPTTSEDVYQQRLASHQQRGTGATSPFLERLAHQLLLDRQQRPTITDAGSSSPAAYEFDVVRSVLAALDVDLDPEALRVGVRTHLDDDLTPTKHADGRGPDAWLPWRDGIVVVEATTSTSDRALVGSEVEPVGRHLHQLEQETGRRAVGVFVAPVHSELHAFLLASYSVCEHVAYRQVLLTDEQVNAVSAAGADLGELVERLEPHWAQVRPGCDLRVVLERARQETAAWIEGLQSQRRPLGMAA